MPRTKNVAVQFISTLAALTASGAVVLQAHAQGSPVESPYAGHRVYRVIPHQMADLLAAETLATVVWSCRPGFGTGIDVQIAPERLATFEAWVRERELDSSLLIPDIQQLIERVAAENAAAPGAFGPRADDWYTSYKSLDQIQLKLAELVGMSNGDAQLVTVGQSLENRTINGLRFSNPDRPGNPRAGRPQIMFEGMQHAREWVSPPTVLYIAEQLLAQRATDPRVDALMDTFEFIIVPVINVDGYVYTWASTNNRLWRKNRRNNGNGTMGVDLNRNWGYEWGGLGTSNQGSSDVYRGPSGFSEPETQVMRDFITSLPRLRGHIDFHSYGQLLLSPWGYSSLIPPDAHLFDSLNNYVAAALAVPHSSTYIAGPSFIAIYPASGVVPDWVYGARDVLGWTIELRDTGETGFVLPPAQILPTAQEAWNGVLTLSERLAAPVLFTLADGHEAFPIAGTPANIHVSIRPSGIRQSVSSAQIQYRAVSDGLNAPWSSFALTTAGRSIYSAALPAYPAGTILQWRVNVILSDGSTIDFAPPSDTLVWMDRASVFTDSFETSLGWVVGPNTASGGIWERADPAATAQQPGDDVSEPGTLCYVTGAAAGSGVNSNDVDGGSTVLTSPSFNPLPTDQMLYSVGQTRVEFWRWSAMNSGNARGDDTFVAEISADNGATWVRVQTVTDNYIRWTPVAFAIEDYVQPTSSMKLRFIATDAGPTGTCEAAVDEVRITRLESRRNPDINQDGGVDGSDVEAFFDIWQTGDPAADFNGDGGVDGGDVELFYYVWQLG